MSDIKEIRPALPIAHVKRRDPQEQQQDKPSPKRVRKKRPTQNSGDAESHQIDEYV